MREHETSETGPEHWLTVDEAKRALYRRDTYFREAWHDARAVLGARAEMILPRIAIVVFKPETVVTRRIPAALAFLQARAFVPIACREIRYTRAMNRAAWRFQYQRDLPTVDRLAVNDLQLAATPALAVLFHDRDATAMQTGSVRLNRFKGSMTPSLRNSDDLRSLVAGPNRMLSGVHVPDEAADVIREIGILFDTDERYALFAEMQAAVADGANVDAEAAAQALIDRFPPITLDPAAALARLRDMIVRHENDGGAGITRLRQIVAAVERGEPLPWQPFRVALREAGIVLTPWDLILIGSQFVQASAEAPADATGAADVVGKSQA